MCIRQLSCHRVLLTIRDRTNSFHALYRWWTERNEITIHLLFNICSQNKQKRFILYSSSSFAIIVIIIMFPCLVRFSLSSLTPFVLMNTRYDLQHNRKYSAEWMNEYKKTTSIIPNESLLCWYCLFACAWWFFSAEVKRYYW